MSIVCLRADRYAQNDSNKAARAIPPVLRELFRAAYFQRVQEQVQALQVRVRVPALAQVWEPPGQRGQPLRSLQEPAARARSSPRQAGPAGRRPTS